MAWDGCRFDSHGHARGRPSNKYHTYSIPFTRIEYGYVRVSIRETRRRHQINLHRDAPHSFVHSRVRPSVRPHHRPRVRSVVISTRERTNERTNERTTTMALSFARISYTAGCVSRLDSTRLDSIERASSSNHPSLAPIDRIARDRILGVRSMGRGG